MTEKIMKISMRMQVYEIIKKKIISQEYDFGAPINIVALSNELGVSNTPIREALSLLEVEGLVVSSLNSKVRVVDISEEFIKEKNHLVLALLLGSYDLCVAVEREAILTEMLEKALEKQKSIMIKADFVEFVNASIAFDGTIVRATGNQGLISNFRDLSTILFMLTRYDHQKSNRDKERKVQEQLHEHEEILEAIKNHQPDKVRKLLFHHYDKHIYGN